MNLYKFEITVKSTGKDEAWNHLLFQAINRKLEYDQVTLIEENYKVLCQDCGGVVGEKPKIKCDGHSITVDCRRCVLRFNDAAVKQMLRGAIDGG